MCQSNTDVTENPNSSTLGGLQPLFHHPHSVYITESNVHIFLVLAANQSYSRLISYVSSLFNSFGYKRGTSIYYVKRKITRFIGFIALKSLSRISASCCLPHLLKVRNSGLPIWGNIFPEVCKSTVRYFAFFGSLHRMVFFRTNTWPMHTDLSNWIYPHCHPRAHCFFFVDFQISV